ncbi:MAG: radical SAM protein [Candidatus Melainabacteria bacterium GWF2_37_15]|nr:MAG: radical SAM protein [Candidatus Melainabacteria bacterium GWF2_37_15]
MPSEIKPVCGLERTKLAEVVPLSTPYSVLIFPTTFCNFKCIYCAHSLGTEEMKKRYNFSKENMDMETYQKIIEQLKQFPEKIKMLSLTGQGEPFFNKNIGQMIRIAKESNVAERIEIISNASLLTKELADEIIDAGLDTLRISLQGLSSQKYKEICGTDINFDEFMNNIKYLYSKKQSTNLFVKILDAALDKGDDEKFYKLFSDYSDRMYIEKMLPVYDGVKATDKMDIKYDRYGREIEKRNVCPLAFFMLGIFPDGDVEPCDTIYKPVVIGNVNHESLFEMWNGKILSDFWKMQLTEGYKHNPKCAVCCAPNDVAHPEDVLDHDSQKILELIERKNK